ncbi:MULTISPECIES: ATP-binding protein [unclassified Pseudoalteromonas]|uniref:ATP-binding protein n=1 Tax=unclassified Pseudoalteromonas TaxID=194690 RepID=UPI0020985DCA|nr:ATP-binding protein [Pseudoalteromonas sp. XMcav2-N]MCO7190995.1 ATP-binding protein [Pseudoalteromonas sp. XMcav2-N]
MIKGFKWAVAAVLLIGVWSLRVNADTSVSSPAITQQITALSEMTNWQEQMLGAERLLQLPELTPEQRASTLKTIGKIALESTRYEMAIRYFEQLEALSREAGLSDSLYHAFKMQGISAFYQGDYSASVIDYQQALVVAEQRAKPIERADIHNNLGMSFIQIHDLEASLEHYLAAYMLYEQYGNEQDRADMLLNLAGVYIRQFRYNKAEELLKRAITLFERLGDEYGVALSQGNLGVIYTESNRPELARTAVKAAVDYYHSINNTRHLAFEYVNMAKLSLLTRDYTSAEQEVNFAMYYAEKADNQAGVMHALHPTARLQLMRGEIDAAEESIDQGLTLTRKLGDRLREREFLHLLALVQAAKGKMQAAAETLDYYRDLQFALLNEGLITRLNKYQSKFEESQLSQELAKMRQAQELQKLQDEQQNQLLWMSGLILCLALISVFAFYHRATERRAKIELSKKVAQRTAQLQQTADELRNANQIKSQFLANISHEIRTPLTAILGHAESLQQDYVHDPHLMSSLGVVTRQGNHLKDLISDVLDLSKIEAQRLELEYTEFTIESLLADVCDMFQRPCMEKSLGLLVENDLPTPYLVRLDYVRLKQILINLLSNAVKFTQEGQVELIIRQQEDGILFIVRDSGIGMSESQVARIFECFQQGDNSITRRFGGSGLGLSLSQHLAKMMGGEISVQSEVERGSQFKLSVPCARLSQASQPDNLEKISHAQSLASDVKLSGTVLLAEDHDDNRALISRLLEKMGLEVDVVGNGREAVERCLSTYPDVVLMDIQMPEMDGLEALKLLRQAGFEGEVYALTANVMEHEIKGYLAQGFSGHLSKPINSDLLYQTLAQSLQRIHASQPLDLSIDMSDLKQSFAQTLEQERYKLIDLWQEQNWQALQHHCHKLNGAASMFEFVHISDIASQFEAALKQEQTALYQDLFLILCDELKVCSYSEQLDVT